jgi:phosphoribosylglycinamide formyltransferase 1
MSRLAVLASGNGSNFEALVRALEGSPHSCALLVVDRPSARALERARRLGVPSLFVGYAGRPRRAAELDIAGALAEAGVDLIALAGFMRVLSPDFVRAFAHRVFNVHPSLLPKWPGAESIRRAYEAGERIFGVTVHEIDEGVDTGPVIVQESFEVSGTESLEEIEERVHAVEHRLFPQAVSARLDAAAGRARP